MSARAAGCEDVRDLLPELALGTTTGQERARALEHLARCPACRRLLDDMAQVADELLLLVPAHEPPVGFESRVIERLAGAPPRRRRWRAAAGALAAAVAAAGAVFVATADDRELGARYRETLATADGRYFTAATLRGAGGDEAGTVFGYEGSPSWMFVTVSAPGRSGRHRIEVLSGASAPKVIGWVTVRKGSGNWGGVLPGGFHEIDSIRLRGGRGKALEAEV
jgi:hypothetical protein